MNDALAAVMMRAAGIITGTAFASIMLDDFRLMGVGLGFWAWTEGALAERSI